LLLIDEYPTVGWCYVAAMTLIADVMLFRLFIRVVLLRGVWLLVLLLLYFKSFLLLVFLIYSILAELFLTIFYC